MNIQDDIDMNSKNQNQERQRVRRSRKDCDGRDYVCGCGKMYLSYPALYTHIKTKHEGKQPIGTKKSSQNNKRGRPKFDEDCIKNFLSLINKEDLNILEHLSEKFEGIVPINNRIRKELLPKEFYQTFNQIKTNPHLKLLPSSSIEMLLVVYLLNIGQLINSTLYLHFITFANMIRDCFKKHVNQVLQECYQQQLSDEIKIVDQCRFLPIICDMLIRYYVPIYHKQVDGQLTTLMMLDLCRWMFKNHLTHIKIQLKNNYDNDIQNKF